MASGPKAIPTWYAGTLFRSRTEARWALLMDMLEIEWDYEPEGYQLPSIFYLPDFWLPQFACFAEVKPLTGWDEEALLKARELSLCSRRCILMLDQFESSDQRVHALVPQPDVGECMRLLVDVMESIRRGCLWYDFGGDDARYAEPEPSWIGAIGRAKNERFRWVA